MSYLYVHSDGYVWQSAVEPSALDIENDELQIFEHDGVGFVEHGADGSIDAVDVRDPAPVAKHKRIRFEHNGETLRAESGWTWDCSCGASESTSTKKVGEYEWAQHRRATAPG